jgi:peptidoglycan hydrolase-like protein with peptidoglycan-binding domain
MKRTSLILLLALLFSLLALAGPPDAKVITGVQATLGVRVDGKMGPKTHAAVKEFQRTKGLQPSGELDSRTLTALGQGGPKPAPPRATHEGSAKPTTPVGPAQSSSERTAEPQAEQSQPTGEK